MKIFKLTVNEKENDIGTTARISSYISHRREKYSQYFLSREKAEARQKEIYEGVHKLIGLVSSFEAVISEIEVIE